jgi:hypothetical protein
MYLDKDRLAYQKISHFFTSLGILRGFIDIIIRQRPKSIGR